jgi:hypothetical protein
MRTGNFWCSHKAKQEYNFLRKLRAGKTSRENPSVNISIFENENFFQYFSKFKTRMGNFWYSHKARQEQVNNSFFKKFENWQEMKGKS